MRIRLVAADIDPEEGVMLRSDFTLLRRYIGLPHFSFLPFLSLKPMYDTIWSIFLGTIRISGVLCTISISEPHILQYIVLGEL